MGVHGGIALGSPERWDVPVENKVETKGISTELEEESRSRAAGERPEECILTDFDAAAPAAAREIRK